MSVFRIGKLVGSFRVGWRSCLPFFYALTLICALAHEATAGLINLADFTLTDSTFASGSGSAVSPDGGLSLVITGPNNGSGEPGTTDLTAIVEQSGVFQFDYLYSSLDQQGYDWAGYLLNEAFYWLADLDGESGTVTLPVLAGNTVGFEVDSVDNEGEPGILTVSTFSSPPLAPASDGVPEPGCCWLTLIGLTLGIAVKLPRRLLRLVRMRNGPWVAAAVTVVVTLPLAAQPPAQYTGANVTGSLVFIRTVNLTQQGQMLQALALHASLPETQPKAPPKFLRAPVKSRSLLSMSSAMITAPAQSLTITGASGIAGFNALSHLDQRSANHGNQFSIEPPSQSIAASTNYVLEGVNDAIQVYFPSGVPALPAVLASNQVFGLGPAIDRNTGVNGVYLTDMRVYFDLSINRWFIIERDLDNDAEGNPLATSHLYLAVSQTADPTGVYNVYVMETTNAAHPGCPCVADYPQVGADQYGFHIAWNEFNSVSSAFVDASILSLSKAALAGGATAPTAYQFLIPYTTAYEFAIQPATTPPGASNFVASGGLEYFASTLSDSGYTGGVALWAMTNTSSLAAGTPNPILSRVVIPTLSYTVPDVATQRPGTLVYGSSLTPPGQLAYLDGGDCRVQALSYAGGRLYLTFPTGVTDQTGRFEVGGAYVVLSPTYRSGVLAATVLNQGYLVINNNHLLRPAIAMNAQGAGAITATLVGPDWYPSATVIPFSTFSTPSTLQVGAVGTQPEDGFTGYPGGGDVGVARWGDYNSAVATSDGAIWMVVQYIGSYPRTEFANWNTYVVRMLP